METIETAQEAHRTGYLVGINHAKNAVMNALRTQLRTDVSNGDVENDYATALYNGVANDVGADQVSTLVTLFYVEVRLFGQTIIETTIEASDEDSAVEAVTDNLSFDSMELQFQASIENLLVDACGEGVVSGWDYDFSDILRGNVEVYATERE